MEAPSRSAKRKQQPSYHPRGKIWLGEDHPPAKIEGTCNQEAGTDKMQKAVR
jgi:hypothetical protein